MNFQFDLQPLIVPLAVIGGIAGILYFMRLAVLAAKTQLVVIDMAAQFRNDSGSTLRDKLDELTRTVATLNLTANDLTKAVADLRAEQAHLAQPYAPATSSTHIQIGEQRSGGVDVGGHGQMSSGHDTVASDKTTRAGRGISETQIGERATVNSNAIGGENEQEFGER